MSSLLKNKNKKRSFGPLNALIEKEPSTIDDEFYRSLVETTDSLHMTHQWTSRYAAIRSNAGYSLQKPLLLRLAGSYHDTAELARTALT